MIQHIAILDTLNTTSQNGPVWSTSSTQLNVNLLRLATGDSIPQHRNTEVDVVFVIFEGAGELIIDGEVYALSQGQIILVPLGAERRLRCTAGPLVYLTCHRRRAGLMPS